MAVDMYFLCKLLKHLEMASSVCPLKLGGNYLKNNWYPSK